jgi:phosphonate transport system permease protein
VGLDIFALRRRNRIWFFLILAVITVGSIIVTEYDVLKGFTSIAKAVTWSLANFYPDAKAMTRLPDILLKLQETVLLAIAATTVAAGLAFLFALLGSNTTRINKLLGLVSRGAASISRNIPDAVWAMILLFSFGQSALTGYFALFFATFGFLTRTFIETIDEVSTSSVEALRATGADYLHIVSHAVIPSALPQMISWILYMVETNIRNSTLIGMLTGTGIGFSFGIYYKSMNYSAASLVVIVIVVTILTIEYLSNYVRRVIL